ncbi:MAG: hypothetical protein QF632_01150, partial [Candidatus Woesearchaeota archaeon]|nr:hypothetical protein [Candidatus Woesearchaeota archaeon]
MVLERLKSKLDTIQEDIAEHEPEEFGLYWHDTKRVKDVEHLVDDFNNLEKLGFSSLPMRRWHVFLLKTVLAAYLGDEAKEQQLARLDQNEIDSLRTFLDLLLLNLKRWKTDGLGSGLLKKYGFPMVQYREVAVFLAKNRSKFIEALVDRVDDEEQTQFIFTEALAASAEANVFQKPALTEEFLLELMAKFPLDGIYDLFLKGFPACSRAGLLNKDYLTVDEILKLNAEKFRSLNDEIRDYRGGVLGWLAKRKYALVMFALLSLTACGKKESSQSSPKASAAVVVQVEELNGDEKGLLNVLNRYTYVKPFVFGYKGKIRGVDKKILNDAQGLSYDAKKLPNSKAGDAALIWFVKEKPTRQRVEVLRAITTDTNKRFLFEDFSSRESMIQDYQLLYEHMSGSLELHPNIKPFLGNPKELDVDILVQALKLQSEHPDLCGKLPAMGKTYRPLDVVFACLEKEWKSEHIVQFFGSVNKLIQKDAYRHLWTMDFSDDQWSNRLSTISPLQVVERDWDSAKWDLMAKIVTVYSVRPSSLRTTDEAAIMAFSERFPKLEATFTLAQLNQRLDLIVGLYGIRPRVITNLLEDVIAAKEMQGIVLSHLDDAQPYWLSPNGIKAQVELRKRIEQGKTGKELFDATGPLTIVLHATDDLNGAFESDGSSWDRYP